MDRKDILERLNKKDLNAFVTIDSLHMHRTILAIICMLRGILPLAVRRFQSFVMDPPCFHIENRGIQQRWSYYSDEVIWMLCQSKCINVFLPIFLWICLPAGLIFERENYSIHLFFIADISKKKCSMLSLVLCF